MDLRVGVLWQQFFVSGERIIQVDRPDGGAIPGVEHSIRIDQANCELIHVFQRAGDDLAGRKSDAGPDWFGWRGKKGSGEGERLKPTAYACEIPGGGVTTAALAFAVEVGLARIGIADQQGRLGEPLTVGFREAGMQESNDIGYLIGRQAGEGRHTQGGASLSEKWSEYVTVPVPEEQRAAHEIGRLLCPGCLRAMTE